MFSAVAAATLALNVISIVVGEVCAALMAVAPTTSVVYAGTPLRITTWSNVAVIVVVAATRPVTLIVIVGCGLVAPSPQRREARFWNVFIALGIGSSFDNKGQGSRGQG